MEKRFPFIFVVALFSITTFADSLESRGWEKEEDDFESALSYTLKYRPVAIGCGGDLVAVAGSISGMPESSSALKTTVVVTGLEARIEEAQLRVKSEAKTLDLQTQCESGYVSESFNLTCHAITGLDDSRALAMTNFVRLETPKINIDMKPGGDCEKALRGLRKIGLDFFEVVSGETLIVPELATEEEFEGSALPTVKDAPRFSRRASEDKKLEVAPPQYHVRSYLEQVNIVSLSLIGSMEIGGVAYGLIRDQDGLIHQVGVGDYLGTQWGRIERIEKGHLELVEIVSDGDGGWLRRPRTIEMDQISE
jgi:Tfp pilus assembly protein PilP